MPIRVLLIVSYKEKTRLQDNQEKEEKKNRKKLEHSRSNRSIINSKGIGALIESIIRLAFTLSTGKKRAYLYGICHHFVDAISNQYPKVDQNI